MSTYTATVKWQRDGAAFSDGKYSRAHEWVFDGGVTVPASASPHVVPAPLSKQDAVDPEEAFVASLSSCHMLWFLHFAARGGFMVDSYRDEAEGVLARNGAGRMAMTEVTLRPQVAFSGAKRPSADEFRQLHHKAHEECYIASSVTTDVKVEPADVSRQA